MLGSFCFSICCFLSLNYLIEFVNITFSKLPLRTTSNGECLKLISEILSRNIKKGSCFNFWTRNTYTQCGIDVT